MDSRHETRGDTRPRWKTRVLKCGWSTRDHENLGNDKDSRRSIIDSLGCDGLNGVFASSRELILSVPTS